MARGASMVTVITVCARADTCTPNRYVCTKTAMECSREEVLAEVWQQLVHWLDHALNATLLKAQFIDPGVKWSPDAPPTNWSPLLINTVNSWWQRPEAYTEIPNLYIAADYARAPQNVACVTPFPHCVFVTSGALLFPQCVFVTSCAGAWRLQCRQPALRSTSSSSAAAF